LFRFSVLLYLDSIVSHLILFLATISKRTIIIIIIYISNLDKAICIISKRYKGLYIYIIRDKIKVDKAY
jgi:hypothetical protein